jgi:hypothetical protein
MVSTSSSAARPCLATNPPNQRSRHPLSTASHRVRPAGRETSATPSTIQMQPRLHYRCGWQRAASLDGSPGLPRRSGPRPDDAWTVGRPGRDVGGLPTPRRDGGRRGRRRVRCTRFRDRGRHWRALQPLLRLRDRAVPLLRHRPSSHGNHHPGRDQTRPPDRPQRLATVADQHRRIRPNSTNRNRTRS